MSIRSREVMRVRIEELRARAEIEELLARYGSYADGGAVDA
jgi:hypothetical protein